MKNPLIVQMGPPGLKQLFFSILSSLAGILLITAIFIFVLHWLGRGDGSGGAAGGVGLHGGSGGNAGNAGGAGGLMRLLGNFSFEPIKEAKKTFSDVKGVDECMDEIKEVVEFLKNGDRFRKMGAKLPRGILLVGPPGVGKTLLAKAVAGEAGVPFFYVSGSEFDEVFVGVGASRVRGLFESARKHSPCIIFIDEIDALGSKRKERDFSGGSKQTINQLLAEMDGFNPRDNIIILGATNLPGALDVALTRPGRFDKTIHVPLPDIKGRQDILQLYTRGKPIDSAVDMNSVAQRAIGFSGADLENLVNEAAIRATVRNGTSITRDDMEYAFDRISMGLEHKTLTITLEEKQRTAYHEAGHAIVTLYHGADKLHKVTITPRGRSLGATHNYPAQTKVTTKKEILNQIQISLGGLVAEEIVYGVENIATGASSDLRGATRMAREMVVMYGMSSDLGAIDYSSDYNDSSSWGASNMFSPETKREVDIAIRSIVNDSHDKVRILLRTHRNELNKLAEALILKETLSAAEVIELLQWKKQ